MTYALDALRTILLQNKKILIEKHGWWPNMAQKARLKGIRFYSARKWSKRQQPSHLLVLASVFLPLAPWFGFIHHDRHAEFIVLE